VVLRYLSFYPVLVVDVFSTTTTLLRNFPQQFPNVDNYLKIILKNILYFKVLFYNILYVYFTQAFTQNGYEYVNNFSLTTEKKTSVVKGYATEMKAVIFV
jgi:hypothetical protein